LGDGLLPGAVHDAAGLPAVRPDRGPLGWGRRVDVLRRPRRAACVRVHPERVGHRTSRAGPQHEGPARGLCLPRPAGRITMTGPARSRRTTALLIALCVSCNAALNVVLMNAGPIPGTLVSTATVLTIAWLLANRTPGTRDVAS